MFSSEKQVEALEKLTTLTEKLTQSQVEYWTLYSHMNTWGFKVVLLMFIIPLIALYFLIDRKNMLLLGFYGMNIHVWFSYINVSGVRQGFFSYPFELIPFIPGNLALDATLIPVLFMLVYQWTINHKKNYYVYSIALSIVLSFIFKPLLVHFGFFILHKGMNYVYIFLLYCVILIFSKLITNVFLKMQNTRPRTNVNP